MRISTSPGKNKMRGRHSTPHRIIFCGDSLYFTKSTGIIWETYWDLDSFFRSIRAESRTRTVTTYLTRWLISQYHTKCKTSHQFAYCELRLGTPMFADSEAEKKTKQILGKQHVWKINRTEERRTLIQTPSLCCTYTCMASKRKVASGEMRKE